MKLAPAIAQDIADAMTLLHPGWQVPGCKALLRDAADLAPAGELSRAALAFAEAPGITAPSLAVFRDPSGSWWHAPMVEHARTIRPADRPRCTLDGHQHETLPCRWCAADEKAGVPFTATPMVLDAIEAAHRGAEMVRVAMTEARRTT